MTTNEYLQKTYTNEVTFRVRPRVKCADGFSISVQANEYTYCSPRITYPGEYKAVELGYPILTMDRRSETWSPILFFL